MALGSISGCSKLVSGRKRIAFFGSAPAEYLAATAFAILVVAGCLPASAQWHSVYNERFDDLATGLPTGDGKLSNWLGGSASGVITDGGKRSSSGKFLLAQRDWQSTGHGPILKLDLSELPHDRVRVRLDLYTFGDWRGLQLATGGPQHRLIFRDTGAQPAFKFDTSFSTNRSFFQSWPEQTPTRRRGGYGAVYDPLIDRSRPYSAAHRWHVQFEYESDSPSFQFGIVSGPTAGRGRPMPAFGIDNMRVEILNSQDAAPSVVEVLPPPRRTAPSEAGETLTAETD